MKKYVLSAVGMGSAWVMFFWGAYWLDLLAATLIGVHLGVLMTRISREGW